MSRISSSAFGRAPAPPWAWRPAAATATTTRIAAAACRNGNLSGLIHLIVSFQPIPNVYELEDDADGPREHIADARSARHRRCGKDAGSNPMVQEPRELRIDRLRLLQAGQVTGPRDNNQLGAADRARHVSG